MTAWRSCTAEHLNAHCTFFEIIYAVNKEPGYKSRVLRRLIQLFFLYEPEKNSTICLIQRVREGTISLLTIWHLKVFVHLNFHPIRVFPEAQFKLCPPLTGKRKRPVFRCFQKQQVVSLENSAAHLSLTTNRLGWGHFKRAPTHGAQSNSAHRLINSKCCTTCSLLTRVVTWRLSCANERIIYPRTLVMHSNEQQLTWLMRWLFNLTT